MFELVFELSTVVFGFGASQLLSAVFELLALWCLALTWITSCFRERSARALNAPSVVDQ